jgi:serine/threonine-protein kinase
MSNSFAGEFIKTFDGFVFPNEISDRFNVMERLSHSEYGETYLLSEKDSSKRYVLKYCSKSDAMNAVHEAKLLQGLSHDGIPAFEPEIEDDKALLVLREYIDGMTLDEYLRENQLSETQVVEITVKLCDILSYLHSQPSPIIHRDIKPSNIIIDPKTRGITLIDFGISRKYSEESDTDTMSFGTQKFAPPEQYGFSQTDGRADIYAVGVLLTYMLTGMTEADAINQLRGRIRKIIKKCRAFAPEKRYPSIIVLKRALLDLSGIRRYKRHFIAASVFIAFIVGSVLTYRWAMAPPPVYEDFLSKDSLTISMDAEHVPLTRASVCKVMVDILDIYDENAESSFPDVPPDHPYYRYISSAVQAKLVQGYAEGVFAPDEPVSPGGYAVLVMDRSLGVYSVTDWSDLPGTYSAAAKAGGNFGIITDEQLAQSNRDPMAPMVVYSDGVLIPKVPYGTWIEWRSSDDSVAVVDSGQVFPVSPGEATITAYYRRIGTTIADTCEITVTGPLSE